MEEPDQLAQEDARLRVRVKQLEDELWDEQVAHDETRAFAFKQTDQLIAAGLWTHADMIAAVQ